MKTSAYDGLSVARDLHDTVAQDLVLAILQIRRASSAKDQLLAGKLIENALAAAQQGLDHARDMIRMLRQVPLRDDAPVTVDLSQSIHATLTGLRAYSDLNIGMECEQRMLVGPQTAEQVTAMVREASMNVIRHARANHLTCRITRDGTRDVRVEVIDDGRGYPSNAKVLGFGILGMRERARLLGGTFDISAGGQRGAIVSIVVPMDDTVRSITAFDAASEMFACALPEAA